MKNNFFSAIVPYPIFIHILNWKNIATNLVIFFKNDLFFRIVNMNHFFFSNSSYIGKELMDVFVPLELSPEDL